MARIQPIEYEEASPAVREQFHYQNQQNGHITNMKRTLLHSLPGYHALMEWFPLRDAALPIIGERGVNLFCHAISTENQCLLCSTYFRRILIEAGESPDELQLNDREQALVDFGRATAGRPAVLEDEPFARLRGFFTDEQIVVLTSFAALMVATNLINTVLEVDLDDDLQSYGRREA